MNVHDQVDLRYGFRVAWDGGATVYYNLSFTSKRPPPYRSASLWLRPDIILDIERDGQRELHAFDAKLRIHGVAPSGEGEHGDDEADPLSFKNDDIAKMHAYRDALPAVRSSRVLYPGEKVAWFPALPREAVDVDGVGAIPLVPGKPPTELVRILMRLLGPDASKRNPDGHAEPVQSERKC
jgi:predicted component of viral defense system (DUF524 family)